MEHNKLSALCPGAHILQDMGWDLWGGYEQTTVPQWDPKIRELKIIYLLAQGAGLLADMLTDALSRGGKNDVSKVTFQQKMMIKRFLFSWECLTWLAGREPWGTRLQDEGIVLLLVLTSAERCWTAPRRRLTRRGPCTTRWSRARLAPRCPHSC